MKIVIVGAGAMGSLFAAVLRKAGREVWLLEKNPGRVRAIKEQGIHVERDAGNWAVALETVTDDPRGIGAADCVILFVKAYDTESAVADSAPCITDATTLVTLQNGIGNVELIGRVAAAEQLLAGTTACGATLLGPGRVRHAGIGDTVIGALGPQGLRRAEALQEVFTACGIATVVSDDIQSVLWGKLLINIGINPLTALMNIRNGQLLDFPQVTAVMRDTVREGMAVAAAKGIQVPFPDPLAKVEGVCTATAANISSMLQDIRAGRKTEIDFINGAVVREGAAVGVETPANAMLTALVRAKEMNALKH